MHRRVAGITLVVSIVLAGACRSPSGGRAATGSTTTTANDVSSAERRAEEDVRAVLAAREAVRWTTVARVLGDGTESCIDGRSDRPVLGTPGGDVGEIVVALGALERTTGAPIDVAALDHLFDEYEASFGKIYFHTDTRAMTALAAALAHDAMFAAVAGRVSTPSELYRFVLAPPAEYRERLLEELTRPEHVGCGHLRLALSNAEAYGVRAALVRAVIAASFRLAWRDPSAVDFVVLDGEHRETAIVEVRSTHDIHAHSRVAMVAPHAAGKAAFVHHPDVAAFVRRENGTFFLEHGRELAPTIPPQDAYLADLEALAHRQSTETLRRLAPSLPTVNVIADEPRLELQRSVVTTSRCEKDEDCRPGDACSGVSSGAGKVVCGER